MHLETGLKHFSQKCLQCLPILKAKYHHDHFHIRNGLRVDSILQARALWHQSPSVYLTDKSQKVVNEYFHLVTNFILGNIDNRFTIDNLKKDHE